MAEKAEVTYSEIIETKQADEEIVVVNSDFIESDESFEQIAAEKSEGAPGKDEVDAKDGAVPEPKRKKSGLLGRLSTRKKKSKSKSKEEENQVNEEKKDPTEAEVNTEEKEEETVEVKNVEIEEISEKTVSDPPLEKELPKEEEVKKEVEVIETPDQTDSTKKKKASRIRRLSFSKIKKSKKAKKEGGENAGAENKDGKESEESKANEDSGSGIVQHVQNECELPESTDQSNTELSLNQPISDKIENGDEQAKDSEGGQDDNGGNTSYLYTVAHMPVDIAQKAIQTIKQVFKPVIIYIVKKNPHCFKDVIENNKKNNCCPTQL